MRKHFLTYLLILLFGMPLMGQSVKVAVAANAQFVVRKLAQDFKKRTGISIQVISGSSGKLATQIKNGAPYDIFLSADMSFAEDVYASGYSIAKPEVYALGSLIICSSTGADLGNWKAYMLAAGNGKIAIGNPELAPYGKAAMQALRYYKVDRHIKNKLVYAESISQVNTYILKGAAVLGFTTQALVYELPTEQNLRWQQIDPASYQPIEQGAVILKHATKSTFKNNKEFYNYLFSSNARTIFKRYGYKVKS